MSEEKQPKKPLTPQEHEEAQQKTDGLVQQQAAFVDMTGAVSDLIDIFGPGTGYVALGKTAFDGKQLNELLDMVEPANPADLEHAGNVLEKATVAINAAAKDLGDFVKATEWEGEGAAAFRTYGQDVVRYAWDVAALANVVGAQMKVASTGLASVRNAMPPRDDRPADEQKKPHQLSAAERQEGNPKYQKAVKVEKDRQEAINQMNRLGSYYAISQSTLASQVLPEPPAAYKAAVPAPAGERMGPGVSAPDGAREAFSRTAGSETGGPTTGVGSAGDNPSRTEFAGRPADAAGLNTSVQIDSVLTPPAPAPAPAPVASPPQTGPTGPVTGNPPPMPTSFGPGRPTPSRVQGTPGVPRGGGGPGKPTLGRTPVTGTGGPTQSGRTSQAVGRATPTSGPAASNGRSGPTVGRPATPGNPNTGRTAVPGANGPVTGRPGMPSQTAPGRQGAPGVPRPGHSNGIVGGTPQRATNGTTGSRIPRATVIGGEDATTGRSLAARPSQSGVIGANQGSAPSRPTGRGTPSANGVVGTPRGAAGSGGANRPGRRQSRDEEQEQTGSSRPDYLTEDERTWADRRRGAVPPVID